MGYVNQIHLIEKGVEQNKEFFKSLYTCDELENVEKWFDKLSEGSIRRRIDKDMTLDKFIENIDSNTYIILQIASPDPLNIRHVVHFNDPNNSWYGWIACPYSDHNFNVLESIYNKTFGCNLKDEPVPKVLLTYHQQRIREDS